MAARLPQKLPLDMMQTKWASILNPLLAVPMTQGLALESIKITTGTNVINHLLGRKQQGWFLTDQDAALNLYRSAPFNNLTLTLVSSAAGTVNLWVY